MMILSFHLHRSTATSLVHMTSRMVEWDVYISEYQNENGHQAVKLLC